MSKYIKNGDLYFPTEENSYVDALPARTFVVGNDPLRGFYLKPIDDFNIKGKIYGKTTPQAERILNTFESRENATGVLLNGEKGSGKTMLAKLISKMAAEKGMPTLVINTPFCGDTFNSFIQSIKQPCVIVFDEFEKVFDNEQQEATLTLLDGVYPTKKLFILTVNDKYKVNSHMRNRPGRIFYLLEYKGLDANFIEEYCQDNLNNKEHIPQVCRLTMLFEAFNFDMLKALVEEMNRYNESPNQALEMLNAKPFDAGHMMHDVEVWVKGMKVGQEHVYPKNIRGNPIAHEELTIELTGPAAGVGDEFEDDEEGFASFQITPRELKKIDPETGTFTYVLDENTENMKVVVIKRQLAKGYNWQDYIS